MRLLTTIVFSRVALHNWLNASSQVAILTDNGSYNVAKLSTAVSALIRILPLIKKISVICRHNTHFTRQQRSVWKFDIGLNCKSSVNQSFNQPINLLKAKVPNGHLQVYSLASFKSFSTTLCLLQSSVECSYKLGQLEALPSKSFVLSSTNWYSVAWPIVLCNCRLLGAAEELPNVFAAAKLS